MIMFGDINDFFIIFNIYYGAFRHNIWELYKKYKWYIANKEILWLCIKFLNTKESIKSFDNNEWILSLTWVINHVENRKIKINIVGIKINNEKNN